MKQVDSSHYYSKVYNTKARFCSYFHQFDEILNMESGNILEIGAGNSFISDLLIKGGYDVTILDIDPDLNPTVVGSVLDMPFSDKSFDVIVCCQVLEHLPYENFIQAISEIYRVSKGDVILSLPNMKPVYRFFIQLPVIKKLQFFITRPHRRLNWKFNGEHYWNIHNRGYSLKRVVRAIKSVNFNIVKQYRVFENPFHHFFVLSKNDK